MIDKKQLAFHEAGHVIIGMIFKLPLDYVTIKDGASHVKWHSYERPKTLYDFPIMEAMVCIAGVVAEGILLGQDPKHWSGPDVDELVKQAQAVVIDKSAKDEEGHFLCWIGYRTKSLLRKNWPQVQIIAAALVEKETLTADEIDFILGIKKRG